MSFRFLLIALMLTASVTGAHAIPITVDSASRSVGGSTTATPGSIVTSSSTSGLFSETATSSGMIEAGPISAGANQISNVSVNGNTLAVTDAGSATLSTIPFSSDPRHPEAPSAFASSELTLQFTLDNWASYNAMALLSASGLSHSIVTLGNSTSQVFLFTNSLENSSGLLAPGVYNYSSITRAIFLSPDSGNTTSSVFSSLTVSMVPEAPTLLLLIIGAAVLGWWQSKKLAI